MKEAIAASILILLLLALTDPAAIGRAGASIRDAYAMPVCGVKL